MDFISPHQQNTSSTYCATVWKRDNGEALPIIAMVFSLRELEQTRPVLGSLWAIYGIESVRKL